MIAKVQIREKQGKRQECGSLAVLGEYLFVSDL